LAYLGSHADSVAGDMLAEDLCQVSRGDIPHAYESPARCCADWLLELRGEEMKVGQLHPWMPATCYQRN
jgi:hypothetical protein